MILPRGEVGPVDFWALVRLAAILRSEISIRERLYGTSARGFGLSFLFCWRKLLNKTGAWG
jgi:hypothetical protein